MSNFLIKTHTVTVGTDAVYVWFLGQIHLNKSQTHTVASALIAAASFLWLFLGQCRNYFSHLQPSRQLKNSTWSYHSPLVASSLIIARSNCNLPTTVLFFDCSEKNRRRNFFIYKLSVKFPISLQGEVLKVNLCIKTNDQELKLVRARAVITCANICQLLMPNMILINTRPAKSGKKE